MDAATRRLVRARADDKCEYCHLPQAAAPLVSFHVEHIVAQQHLQDDSDNLALSCDRCNAYKGPNLATIDLQSDELIPLFHPRREAWKEHFRFDGPVIVGLTRTGVGTVRLLQMNAEERLAVRVQWLAEGERLS